MEPFCSTVFNFVVSELQPLTFYVKEFGFLLSILFGIAIIGNVFNCFFFLFSFCMFSNYTRVQISLFVTFMLAKKCYNKSWRVKGESNKAISPTEIIRYIPIGETGSREKTIRNCTNRNLSLQRPLHFHRKITRNDQKLFRTISVVSSARYLSLHSLQNDCNICNVQTL